MEQQLKDVFENFLSEGLGTISPINEGLINHSYLVETTNRSYYILQRINRDVFSEPQTIMQNIEKVHHHLKGVVGYQAPEIVKTLAGNLLFEDPNGFSWRLMRYIPNSRTFNQRDI